MTEFVDMYHAETGNTASATREAFDTVWATRGWKLNADVAAELTTEVLNAPDDHSDAQLRLVLDQAGGGFVTSGTETREDLLGRVAILQQHAESPQASEVGQKLAELRGDTAGTYDPNDHTVAEVNQWLSFSDRSEVERVLAAEAQGQNRKGIVEGPYTGSLTNEEG